MDAELEESSRMNLDNHTSIHLHRMDNRDIDCIDVLSNIDHQNKPNHSHRNNSRVEIVSHTRIDHRIDLETNVHLSNNEKDKE